MKACPNCGQPNPEEDRFCVNCGTQLPEAEQNQQAAETAQTQPPMEQQPINENPPVPNQPPVQYACPPIPPQPPAVQQSVPAYPYGQPVYQPPKKKGLQWWHILLIVLGVVVAVFIFYFVLRDNSCKHQWKEATIYYPKTCVICGETEGTRIVESNVITEGSKSPTIIVSLPTLPKEINEYSWDDTVKTSCTITSITYEVSDDDLYIYFTGEKISDSEGTGYARACKVGWRLIDSENYVVDTGTFYSPSLRVGEKFKNEKDNAWDCIEPGKTYTLEISSVK